METLSQILINQEYATICDALVDSCVEENDELMTRYRNRTAELRNLIGYVLQGGRLTEQLLQHDPVQAMRLSGINAHGYTGNLQPIVNIIAFNTGEFADRLTHAIDEVVNFLYPDTRALQ